MKKIMTLMAMLTIAIGMFAKDIKTVVFTTNPQMHCENCENKIKGNLRFEKGIKEITTSVADQKVTVKYDADKTTPDNIIKGFAKIGYTATVKTTEGKSCGGCKKKAENGKCGGCNKKTETGKCGGCAKKANAEKGECCKMKANAEKSECCTEKAEAGKCGDCNKKANTEKGECCKKK
jgi:periplasmic mercuric ion binding protein